MTPGCSQSVAFDKLLHGVSSIGPDGLFHSKFVGGAFGFSALHTTSQSLREQQPFEHRPSGCVVVADARIDNRNELFDKLGVAKSRAKTWGDGELILHCYLKWGDDCAQFLLGDFAFAIWNSNSRQLFLARDVCGVKPLYYSIGAGFIIFASNIEAILASSPLPHVIDQLRVAEFVFDYVQDFERTFWNDIKRLKRGSKLNFSDGNVAVTPFWEFDPSKTIKLSSEEEYAEAFREILTESVRCRLPETGPVCCALSGGLDSSSITCLADGLVRESKKQEVHTLSCIFPGLRGSDFAKVDERGYMDSVVARCSTSPHFIECDRKNPFDYGELVGGGEPAACFNMYLNQAMFEETKRIGSRVFLDGHGGDSTVAYGTQIFYELGKSFKLCSLLREVSSYAKLHGYKVSYPFVVKQYVLKPFIPVSLYEKYFQLRTGKDINLGRMGKLLRPALTAKWLECHANEGKFNTAPWKSSRELHVEDMVSPLDQTSLEDIYRLSSVYKLEARFPFLDRRLMEFSLAVPMAMKLRNGYDRYLLRVSMKKVLPETVRMREGKAKLSPNFLQYVLREGEQKQRTFFNSNAVLSSFVDIDEACKWWQKYKDSGGKKRLLGEKLFLLFVIGQWLETRNDQMIGV